MLIKTMSRKKPSFRQLLIYFDHEQHSDEPRYTHNCLKSPDDREGLIQELEENSLYLPKRNGGTYLHHDILSFEPGCSLSPELEKSAIVSVVRQYLRLRAEHQPAVFKLHQELGHTHVHIAIASNECRGNRRCWLSKSGLRNIQKTIERWQQSKYPALGLVSLYDKGHQRAFDPERPILGDKEIALKRRTKRLTQKEQHAAIIRSIFATVSTELELNESLNDVGFTLYKRGKSGLEGVRSADGTKYRLRTLGLENEMLRTEQRLAVFKERQADLIRTGTKAPHRDRNRGRS